jgi:hypothetical protein
MPPSAGSLLAEYEIDAVAQVSTDTDRRRLRTLVLYARHRDSAELSVAIKITPITHEVRRDDFVREQQIHYLLTQMDAAAVRQAASRKPRTPEWFTADERDPLAHEDAVARSVIAGDVFNVVPLYDFVIQYFDGRGIPLVSGYEQLAGVDFGRGDAAITVQRKIDGTLKSLLGGSGSALASTTTSLYVVVRSLRYAIVQICCILHVLLAIGFTHGDVHAGNVGYVTTTARRHYKLAQNKVFAIPDTVPSMMLIDFDRSRAEMSDATGKRFVMIPSAASLRARFGRVVDVTPAQSFSPMVDVFRLVHSAIVLFAQFVSNGSVSVAPARSTEDFPVLVDLFRAGISNLPDSITRISAYETVRDFVDVLAVGADDKVNPLADKINGDSAQGELWYRLYSATPQERDETTKFLMPWDVLARASPSASEPSDSRDMTLAPLYDKGKVYRPWDVPAASDEVMRVHPLRSTT